MLQNDADGFLGLKPFGAQNRFPSSFEAPRFRVLDYRLLEDRRRELVYPDP